MGTTSTAVQLQFPAVINYNFTYATNADATFSQLTDIELARLTREYYIDAGNTLAPLAQILAQHLSATSLQRFRSAAGQAVTDAAVMAYAPTTVRTAYQGLSQLTAIPRSQANYIMAGMSPNVSGMAVGASGIHEMTTTMPNLNQNLNHQMDMTLYEIYLEYRTALTAMTITEALVATGTYATGYLGKAFAAGYYGTKGTLYLIDQISAGFSANLTSQLGGIIQDVVTTIITPPVPLTKPNCGCSVTVGPISDFSDNGDTNTGDNPGDGGDGGGKDY